jgi:hypothetical protein
MVQLRLAPIAGPFALVEPMSQVLALASIGLLAVVALESITLAFLVG